MNKLTFIAVITLLAPAVSIATVNHLDECRLKIGTALQSQGHELVDDSNKPQSRPWAKRFGDHVDFDLTDMIKSAQAHIPASELKNAIISLRVNGDETDKYPWGTNTIRKVEPDRGQLDYYVVIENSDRTKKYSISELNMRETHDSQNIDGRSFAKFLQSDRILGVEIGEGLRERGLDPALTEKSIEKGYTKIVWTLRPNADKKVVDFINSAKKGVAVFVAMGDDGVPTSVTVTDRELETSVQTDVKNFFFKVDAAFNANAFFWDDMLVSLATISHHPWLVRSTLEFWLTVQKMNKGVIPREVRKGNLKSLWYDSIIKPGQKEGPNLQYTNPYLMNWVAEKLVASDPSPENLALMKKVVTSMEQYTQWIEQNRSVKHNGEFIGFVTNALGSGLDNSRGSRGNDHSPESYQSGWVDVLAQQISMYKSIKYWKKTFDPKWDDEKIQNKITSLENLLNTKYWNEELGFYFDLIPDGQGGLKQDTKYFSVAGFWPLYSASASPAQVNKIIHQQLTDTHFGGVFPFPANSMHSIALDEKEDGYWNGDSRWPSMAAIAIEGLRNSGRPEVAYEMAVRFLRSVTQANPNTVAEFYGLANKLIPGQGIGRVGQHGGHTTRLDFAGWGKVPPVYMMLESILGLVPQLDGHLTWNVMMPLKVGEALEVRNYMYRGTMIKSLRLQKVGDDKFSLKIQSQKPLSIDVRSFRDKQDHLSATPHPVTVL